MRTSEITNSEDIIDSRDIKLIDLGPLRIIWRLR